MGRQVRGKSSLCMETVREFVNCAVSKRDYLTVMCCAFSWLMEQLNMFNYLTSDDTIRQPFLLDEILPRYLC